MEAKTIRCLTPSVQLFSLSVHVTPLGLLQCDKCCAWSALIVAKFSGVTGQDIDSPYNRRINQLVTPGM